MTMKLLRTPDDRFTALPDFPYEPHYAEVGDGIRVAYFDEGSRGAAPVLLLHGEPSWSFLYRHVIRVLADSGIRCVAPDLVGFGRSDKPAAPEDHTFARHVEWVRELAFDHLDLGEVTLVGQDWGGLIGLRLVAEQPGRFARVVAANTGLPMGDVDMPEIWWLFHDAVAKAPVLDIGRLVAAGCVRGLGDAARAAYDAPFPTEESKVGPRVMPTLVPVRPDDPAPRPTGGRGRSWVSGTARSSPRSATPTRSPAAWTRSSSTTSPARSRSPSREPATSSRRTPARSWAPSSPPSSRRRDSP